MAGLPLVAEAALVVDVDPNGLVPVGAGDPQIDAGERVAVLAQDLSGQGPLALQGQGAAVENRRLGVELEALIQGPVEVGASP